MQEAIQPPDPNARGREPGTRERHGMKGTRTYRIWKVMLTRCNNPNVINYSIYGGRGITVCPRWWSFVAFLADMGDAPDGLTLDRKDGDKNYEPDNCRWATYSEQNNNRGDYNVFYTLDGVSLTLPGWCRRSGVCVATARTRLARGWDFRRAVTEPPRPIKLRTSAS